MSSTNPFASAAQTGTAVGSAIPAPPPNPPAAASRLATQRPQHAPLQVNTQPHSPGRVRRLRSDSWRKGDLVAPRSPLSPLTQLAANRAAARRQATLLGTLTSSGAGQELDDWEDFSAMTPTRNSPVLRHVEPVVPPLPPTFDLNARVRKESHDDVSIPSRPDLASVLKKFLQVSQEKSTKSEKTKSKTMEELYVTLGETNKRARTIYMDALMDIFRALKSFELKHGSPSEELIGIYELQRKFVIAIGVQPSEIMDSALAVMDGLAKIHSVSVKRDGSLVPNKHPFKNADFLAYYDRWKTAAEKIGVSCARIDEDGAALFSGSLLLRRKTGIFGSKREWMEVQVVLSISRLEVWSRASEVGASEAVHMPFLVIEIHSKLRVCEAKVYKAKKNARSIRTFELHEKDPNRLKKGLNPVLARLGSDRDEQFGLWMEALRQVGVKHALANNVAM